MVPLYTLPAEHPGLASFSRMAALSSSDPTLAPALRANRASSPAPSRRPTGYYPRASPLGNLGGVLIPSHPMHFSVLSVKEHFCKPIPGAELVPACVGVIPWASCSPVAHLLPSPCRSVSSGQPARSGEGMQHPAMTTSLLLLGAAAAMGSTSLVRAGDYPNVAPYYTLASSSFLARCLQNDAEASTRPPPPRP